LKAYQGDPSDPGQLAYLKAMMGDVGFAERFVANSGSNESHNTVIESIYVPLVNALLALKNHKPEEALRLLEPTRVYQLRDFTVPSLRAQAETEAGKLEDAAADYRLILDNQGVDPISPLSSLAHLRLARVLVLERKIDAARTQYREFLSAWRDADQNIAQLGEARRELAQLH